MHTLNERDVCGGRDNEKKRGDVGEDGAEPLYGVVAVEQLAIEEAECQHVGDKAAGL